MNNPITIDIEDLLLWLTYHDYGAKRDPDDFHPQHIDSFHSSLKELLLTHPARGVLYYIYEYSCEKYPVFGTHPVSYTLYYPMRKWEMQQKEDERIRKIIADQYKPLTPEQEYQKALEKQKKAFEKLEQVRSKLKNAKEELKKYEQKSIKDSV